MSENLRVKFLILKDREDAKISFGEYSLMLPEPKELRKSDLTITTDKAKYFFATPQDIPWKMRGYRIDDCYVRKGCMLTEDELLALRAQIRS